MRWIVAAAVVLAELVLAGTAHAQTDHKQILVLYSTRRDAQFSVVGESELPRMLDVALARNIDYYSEFLDSARFPEPAYREGYVEFLRLKYGNVRLDLVIVLQDPATEFVDSYREQLFPGTPVVFLTNSATMRRRSNSTGVIHERNFTLTIDCES